MSLLSETAIFLGAAVLAVPLFRRLKLGAVLGYTFAVTLEPAAGIQIRAKHTLAEELSYLRAQGRRCIAAIIAVARATGPPDAPGERRALPQSGQPRL